MLLRINLVQLIEWPMRIKWKTRADDLYVCLQARATGAAAAEAAARWAVARPQSRPSCLAYNLFKITEHETFSRNTSYMYEVFLDKFRVPAGGFD